MGSASQERARHRPGASSCTRAARRTRSPTGYIVGGASLHLTSARTALATLQGMVYSVRIDCFLDRPLAPLKGQATLSHHGQDGDRDHHYMTLRPYQREAIDALMRSFAPTGVAESCYSLAWVRPSSLQTLVKTFRGQSERQGCLSPAAHREEVVAQTTDKIASNPGLSVSIVKSGL